LTSKILYKSSVSHDLKKASLKDRERILRQIRTVLEENPRKGEALHGEFSGLFKLRVGDYRVIYSLSGQDVLVLRIRQRAKAHD
jgi:mRNA interferase RelE/StbE